MGAAEKLPEAAREIHEDPGKPSLRVRYIVDLMVNRRFERGVTVYELAEDWGMSIKSTEGYATDASRHLELLGDRDYIMQLVRDNARQWVSRGEGDRVPAARLLLETVGGLVQKHEHRVEVSQRSDSELFALMLSEVRADPVLRAKAIAFLTAESPDVGMLTEGTEVDG